MQCMSGRQCRHRDNVDAASQWSSPMERRYFTNSYWFVACKISVIYRPSNMCNPYTWRINCISLLILSSFLLRHWIKDTCTNFLVKGRVQRQASKNKSSANIYLSKNKYVTNRWQFLKLLILSFFFFILIDYNPWNMFLRMMQHQTSMTLNSYNTNTIWLHQSPNISQLCC